jgi:hypothetical protein
MQLIDTAVKNVPSAGSDIYVRVKSGVIGPRAITEAHYLQRHTRGPDVRDALDKLAAGQSGG